MKKVITREGALDVIKKAERFGNENDMWSVIVFHKDALCNTIYYEVSYFDNNIRRDDFIEAVKLNLQRVKVDFAIYVGNTHMFSYGTLFEED